MSTLLRGATSRSIRKSHHAAAVAIWRRNVTFDKRGKPSIPRPERSPGLTPPTSKAYRRRIEIRAKHQLRAWLESPGPYPR
jgi:hypothetical protein